RRAAAGLRRRGVPGDALRRDGQRRRRRRDPGPRGGTRPGGHHLRRAVRAGPVSGPAPETTVRLAAEGDAPAIARIYNQGIEDRIATFETEPRTAAAIVARLRGHGAGYPTVVWERGGRDGAWTGVQPARARPLSAGGE